MYSLDEAQGLLKGINSPEELRELICNLDVGIH